MDSGFVPASQNPLAPPAASSARALVGRYEPEGHSCEVRMGEYDIILVQERRERLAQRGIVLAAPPAEKRQHALSLEDRRTLASLANAVCLRRYHEGRLAEAALMANEFAYELGEYWPMGAEGAVLAGMELALEWRFR